MRSLCIIVARGASKRIPLKNISKIGKHSLVYWVSKAALKSNFDDVVISTENKHIAKEAEKAGIQRLFWRPKNLCKDYSNDLDIIKHALKATENIYKKKYKYIGLIQPTTPFIRVEHINQCLKKLKKENLSCVFTAREIKEHPRMMWKINKKNISPYLNKKIKNFEQHFQKLKKYFIPNGGIWCMDANKIIKQKTIYAYPINLVKVPFQYSIDIDNSEDLLMARMIYKEFDIKTY
jgi:CMP-N-acetylneuraminic acid synthetase